MHRLLAGPSKYYLDTPDGSVDLGGGGVERGGWVVVGVSTLLGPEGSCVSPECGW